MSAIIDKNVIDAAYEKWRPVAATVEESPLGAPAPVIFGEAVEVAMLFNAYWQPTVGSIEAAALPGFVDVAESSALHENLGSEIYEIQAAAGKANADYGKAVEGSKVSPMVRAEFVFHEIKATLEFLFDDDEHTVADDQLEKLANDHARPTSQDFMAVALEAYVALAEDYREELTTIKGFDLALLDEARALAGALRMRSGEALVGGVTSGASVLLVERNRLITLLQDRVARVRRAARYVFRAHPDIARKFASSYHRNRRQSLRKRKAAEATQAAAEPTV